MQILKTSWLLACLMAAAAALGIAAKPSTKAAHVGPRFVLEQAVPAEFGNWRELPGQGNYVVNPQTQQLLDKLYSQLLARTYADANGYRIMLSLAYGEDQRGDLTAHKPEVCYPAQGFALHSNQETTLATPFGPIAARRLDTSLGSRKEPVTYWFTVGDTAIRSKWDQRLVEMRLGLTGQIPDGLLFRVSSIDDQPERAWRMQQRFVDELLSSTSSLNRARLSGLGSKTGAP